MTDFVDYKDAEKVLQAEAMAARARGTSEDVIEEGISFLRKLQQSGQFGVTVRERHQMILDGKGTFVGAL